MKSRSVFEIAGCASILLLGACAAVSAPESSPAGPTWETTQNPSASETSTTVHPDMWPEGKVGVANNPATDARAAEILSQMTVAEKVGQIIQADIASVTPADVQA